MASNKPEPEIQEPEIQEPERVTITLPYARAGEEKDLFVAINGVGYLIPKGKPVEVPAAVADEIRRSQEAERAFRATVDAMQLAAK